LNVTTVSPTI